MRPSGFPGTAVHPLVLMAGARGTWPLPGERHSRRTAARGSSLHSAARDVHRGTAGVPSSCCRRFLQPLRAPVTTAAGEPMSTETSGPTSVGRAAVPEPRTGDAPDSTVRPVTPATPAPPVPGADYRRSVFWRVYDGIAEAIDRRVGWDKLPVPAGLAVLMGIRNILRQKNLHDPSAVVPITNAVPVPPRTQEHLVSRSVDGTYNDLDHPDMGRAGARFGRNIPLDGVLPVTHEQLMEPSPREVSRRLLTRTTFLPAETINTLAAAWLQFMIKDWFSHGEGDTSRLVEIPLEPGDTWWEDPMRIPRIKPDPTRPEGADGPITTVNDLTHWWDGSSIYGITQEEQQRVRSGRDGKLHLTDDGRLLLP